MEDKKVLKDKELEKVTGGDRELSQLVGPNALSAIPTGSPLLKDGDGQTGEPVLHPQNTKGWFDAISGPNVVGYDQTNFWENK